MCGSACGRPNPVAGVATTLIRGTLVMHSAPVVTSPVTIPPRSRDIADGRACRALGVAPVPADML